MHFTKFSQRRFECHLKTIWKLVILLRLLPVKVKDGTNYEGGCVVYAHLFKWEWLETQTCLPEKQPGDYNNFWSQLASAIHELYIKELPAYYYFSQSDNIQYAFLFRTAKHQAYPGRCCNKGHGAGREGREKTAAYLGPRPHFYSWLGFRFGGCWYHTVTLSL